MEEFNKFSISELNTGIFIIDAFLDKNSQDPGLINLRYLMKKEIENRTHLTGEKGLENLKTKYLGKYMGFRSSDSIEYFRVDKIEYIEEIGIITIGSKLIIICLDDNYTNILYNTEPIDVSNLNPSNPDMRDFFDVSEAEFKGKLDKIITNGLA